MSLWGEAAEVRKLIRLLRFQAAEAGHRRLLVFSGRREWGMGHAAALVPQTGAAEAVWVGTTPADGVRGLSGREVLRLLGTETRLLVVDAWSGFDPDAFGAATGMVTGGGLVVLLTPPLGEWPGYADPELRRISMDGVTQAEFQGRFIRRLVQVLERDPHAVIVREGDAVPRPQPSVPGLAPPAPAAPYRTEDQACAVEAVLQVVCGHRRRPLVLTADRGRGKSAALGLAVARLAEHRQPDVLVTAPDEAAVEAVFRHAAGTPGLRYMPPDRLLAERPKAGLLLVDEAAGLPVASLTELVRHYPRVVFSSTVHGYEGTGRGFALRFRSRLDELAPGWRELHLDAPVRWMPGDPVEQFTFRALLLDAVPASPPEVSGHQLTVQLLDRNRLLDQPEHLEALFGLLVQAHYRTRPLDLRNLLDGPGLCIHAAFLGESLVGALLAVREGGFDHATADAIWAGYRRPHGHLLAQSLAAHVGVRRAPREQVVRVMRIAVHPGCRRSGIGVRLVQAAAVHARDGGAVLLGTSFGATPDLLTFWHTCGLRPVRAGTRRDAASGTHSVLMVQGLQQAGHALQDEAVARFADTLPAQLTDPLRTLDPALAAGLITRLPEAPVPDRGQWGDAAAFAWGRREFAVCLRSLRVVAWWGVADPAARDALEPGQVEVLVRRVLQGGGWAEVADAVGLPGRGGVLKVLRQAIRTLARSGAPADLLADPVFRDHGPD